MTINTEDKILNTSQAAKIIGCSPITLRRYAETKIIPATKIAGRWRFSKENLLAKLKSNA
ncbi:MAG: helix-turn-helix domain-containing protein [Flavobacterium sp.]